MVAAFFPQKTMGGEMERKHGDEGQVSKQDRSKIGQGRIQALFSRRPLLS